MCHCLELQQFQYKLVWSQRLQIIGSTPNLIFLFSKRRQEVRIIKWKNLAEAYGSEAIFLPCWSDFGPAVLQNQSRSISSLAMTWAIGSWSEGFMVIQRLRGLKATIILQTLERMACLFSSDPVTLLWTARRCCQRILTPTWLNNFPSTSSILASLKSSGCKECSKFWCWVNADFWIWRDANQQTVVFEICQILGKEIVHEV